MKGEVPLEGGWRVYSSGAGIATGLIMRCLFGFLQGKSDLVVDPVIPTSLDGLRVRMQLRDGLFDVTYHSSGAGCGPSRVSLNGCDLPFTRSANPIAPGLPGFPWRRSGNISPRISTGFRCTWVDALDGNEPELVIFKKLNVGSSMLDVRS